MRASTHCAVGLLLVSLYQRKSRRLPPFSLIVNWDVVAVSRGKAEASSKSTLGILESSFSRCTACLAAVTKRSQGVALVAAYNHTISHSSSPTARGTGLRTWLSSQIGTSTTAAAPNTSAKRRVIRTACRKPNIENKPNDGAGL